MEAFLVEAVLIGQAAASQRPRRYAALVATPAEALAAVQKLVSPGSVLRVVDERLSPAATVALGLRPAQARLV